MNDDIRVLHVDDDPDFADLTATFLEREHEFLAVETATDVEAGLARLDAESFDCVVSDYEMPSMDGIEFLQTVRDMHGELPFILFTGKGSEEVASDAISAGATDYLQKEAGTEQYKLLGNRIRNAVRQFRGEQAQQRLVELAESTDRILFVFDDDWSEMLFINSAYEDILERPVEQLRENPTDFLNAIHPTDRERARDAMDTVSMGESTTIELRLDTASGTDRWIRIRAEPIRDASGAVVRVAGFASEITRQKRRERELRRNERRFQAMFEDPNILVGLIDLDGTMLDVNETAVEYVAADREEIVDEVFWNTPWFAGDESLQADVEEWVSRATTGEYVDFEVTIERENGEAYTTTGVLRPVTNDTGDVTSLLISSRDITARTKREQELERYAALIETLPIGYVRTTVAGEFVDMNSTYVRALGGSTKSDILSRDVAAFYRDPATREELLASLAANGEVVDQEVQLTTLDTEERWVSITARRFDADGGPFIDAIVQDITDRKQREQELQTAEEHLRLVTEHVDEAILISRGIVSEPAVYDARPEDTGMEYVSAGVADIWGESVEAILDDPGLISDGIHPDDRDEYLAHLERMGRDAQAGEPDEQYTFECRVQAGRGETIWIRTTSVPVPIPESDAYRWISTVRDISDYKAREQELQRYERIIEASGDAVYTLDAAGHLTYVNQAFCELVEYSREELLGEHVSIVMDSEDIERGEAIIRDLLDSDRTQETWELALIQADGDRVITENHMALLPFDEEFQGTTGIHRDITARKQRERELEQYETMIDTVPDGVYTLDDDFRYQAVNKGMAELTGYPQSELIGSHFSKVTNEDGIETAEQSRAELAASEDPNEIRKNEITYRTADGELILCETRFRALPSENGFRGTAGTVRDISDHKARERELELYETMLETIPDGVYALDEDLRYIAVNQSMEELTGYSREELLGSHISIINEEDAVETAHRNRETIKQADTDQVFHTERTHYKRDGTPVHCEARFRPLPPDDEGNFRGTSGVLRDISEQRRRERELERQNERFDEIASVVSHDLQTPLATARGYVELAIETGDTEPLDDTIAALERLDELRTDLVDVLRSRQIVGDKTAVDIAELASETWEASIGAHEAELEVHDFGRVIADPDALTRCFENLFTNVVEHGGSGVSVRIGAVDDGFFVEDDGPGIALDEREDIFLPGQSTKTAGSGMGLTSVRQIVEAHGWEIHVTDAERLGGARFEITGVEFVRD